MRERRAQAPSLGQGPAGAEPLRWGSGRWLEPGGGRLRTDLLLKPGEGSWLTLPGLCVERR